MPLVLLLLAGCGEGGSGVALEPSMDPSGRPIYLEVRRGAGAANVAQRIDGDIEEAVSRRLWGGEDQWVVATGTAPGEDQHKVIAFASDGRRLAEWAPSSRNPYDFLQYQHPVSWSQRVLDIGDRRFLATFTKGIFFPSSFVLIEVESGHRLSERLEVWNPGLFNQYEVEGVTLGLVGLNNKLQVVGGEVVERNRGARYAMAVCIVDLSGLPRSPGRPVERVVIPSLDISKNIVKGSGFSFYYLLPVLDSRWESQGSAVRFDGGELRASMACGLTFVADIATGEHRFECSEAFRSAWTPSSDSTATGVDGYLRELESRVRRWRGTDL